MSSETTRHFGPWFVALRESRGFKSGNSFALAAEVSQALLNKVERGERAPTDEFLQKVAPTLGVTFDTLKREALKDELGEQLPLAAEAALEEATPEQAEQAFKFWFRRSDLPPEEKKAFMEKMNKLAKAWDENWDDIGKHS